MKYKIVEIPQVGSDPVFRIQGWGHRLNTSLWSNKKTECWCSVSKTGYTIDEGYRYEFYEDCLGSFKSLKEAQKYLYDIIEYRKKKVKTVFEIET